MILELQKYAKDIDDQRIKEICEKKIGECPADLPTKQAVLDLKVHGQPHLEFEPVTADEGPLSKSYTHFPVEDIDYYIKNHQV